MVYVHVQCIIQNDAANSNRNDISEREVEKPIHVLFMEAEHFVRLLAINDIDMYMYKILSTYIYAYL